MRVNIKQFKSEVLDLIREERCQIESAQSGVGLEIDVRNSFTYVLSVLVRGTLSVTNNVNELVEPNDSYNPSVLRFIHYLYYSYWVE